MVPGEIPQGNMENRRGKRWCGHTIGGTAEVRGPEVRFLRSPPAAGTHSCMRFFLAGSRKDGEIRHRSAGTFSPAEQSKEYHAAIG